MNGKYLLNKMELADPKYIDEAERSTRKKAPIMWKQWTALAACLAIAVASGIMLALSPDGLTVQTGGAEDAASLFGSGSLMLVVLVLSLLAAAGIATYIIAKKRK